MSGFISAASTRSLLAVVAGAALLAAGCSGSSHDGAARRNGHPSASGTPSASASGLPGVSAPGAGEATTPGNATTEGGAGSATTGVGPSGQERVVPSRPSGSGMSKARTVQGTMQVEGLCKILVSGFDRWVLLGSGVSDLRDGERIQAVGTPSPTEENPCDGAVLHVDSIRRV